MPAKLNLSTDIFTEQPYISQNSAPEYTVPTNIGPALEVAITHIMEMLDSLEAKIDAQDVVLAAIKAQTDLIV